MIFYEFLMLFFFCCEFEKYFKVSLKFDLICFLFEKKFLNANLRILCVFLFVWFFVKILVYLQKRTLKYFPAKSCTPMMAKISQNIRHTNSTLKMDGIAWTSALTTTCLMNMSSSWLSINSIFWWNRWIIYIFLVMRRYRLHDAIGFRSRLWLMLAFGLLFVV